MSLVAAREGRGMMIFPVAFLHKPAIPRRFLLLLAGLFWAIAGLILCVRGFEWVEVLGVHTMVAVESASVVVAAVAYILWFSKLVLRNITRIKRLPDWACAFAFTAWHGYFMIGVMMTVGIALRNSDIPRIYLAIPYGIMGGMLLVGSAEFFREFAGAKHEPPSSGMVSSQSTSLPMQESEER
jgi:hypothetical protein